MYNLQEQVGMECIDTGNQLAGARVCFWNGNLERGRFIVNRNMVVVVS
jgi:hypothetical protein